MTKTKGPKTTCTQKVADDVLKRIAGGDSLSQICRDLKLNYNTVYHWMDVHRETYFKNSTHAYKAGYDKIAEDCLAIADDSHNDKIKLEDGREVVNSEAIQRSRLKIDTRLRLLGKWSPKRYGDKLALSGDEVNPIRIESITRTIIDPKKHD